MKIARYELKVVHRKELILTMAELRASYEVMEKEAERING